jgi:hypothetical protein
MVPRYGIVYNNLRCRGMALSQAVRNVVRTRMYVQYVPPYARTTWYHGTREPWTVTQHVVRTRVCTMVLSTMVCTYIVRYTCTIGMDVIMDIFYLATPPASSVNSLATGS